MVSPCVTLHDVRVATSSRFRPCPEASLAPFVPGRPMQRRWPLHANPKPLAAPFGSPPTVSGVLLLGDHAPRPPTYTLSLPVHNREHTIASTLASIFATSVGAWELIVVLDSCSDRSEQVVWEWLLDVKSRRYWQARERACACAAAPALPTRVVVVRTPPAVPLYETAADNWAMSATSPSGFYLLMQADTRLHEHGWNAKMASLAYRISPAAKRDNAAAL